MTTALWYAGPSIFPIGHRNLPIVWYVRLDDPGIEQLARGASLSRADLKDLATLPDGGMRSLRRRLSKILLAHLTGLHPDEIVIGRTAFGAPRIDHPTAWTISLGGRWPHCLIGVSQSPIGVDIEPLDALPPPEDAFTKEELEGLEGMSNEILVARWTAKEAHAKSFGMASTIDAAEISICPSGDHVHAVSRLGTTICTVRRHGDTLQALALPQT